MEESKVNEVRLTKKDVNRCMNRLYIGAEIYRGSSQSDGIEILKSLYVVIVAFIVWCWVAACALRVSSISKKLNAYIPPANDFKSKTYDFSSILNNRYP